jgi:hypothetical protein
MLVPWRRIPALVLTLALTSPALTSPALAAPTAPTAARPPTGPTASVDALTAISTGDRAWWHGDRGAAVRAWQGALDEAGDGARGHAIEAMARVRLLQLGGNAGPFVHEAKLDRALADCPTTEPWCAIAAADWALFMPAFTGADPGDVPALLAGSPLLGPAVARLAVATGDATPLAALPDDALDGMGLGIRETGRLRPPAPGTWVVGLGVGGAPGAGVGLTVRLVHPDLAWKAHRLEVVAGGDTRGGMLLSGTLVTATRPSRVASATLARAVGDLWVGATPTPYALGTGRLSLAVAPRWGELGVQVGGSVRGDILGPIGGEPSADGGPLLVAGPSAAVSAGDAADAWVRVGVDTGFGSYTHVALTAETRLHPTVAGGTLAMRAAITTVPTDSPFFRLPTAGGTDLLRGLPAGRYRDDTVFAGQVEYRHTLWGPLRGALFVDTARAEGWHVTAGGGLRIVLPPDRFNVTRLDVGAGPDGWGVVAAWGEAF